MKGPTGSRFVGAITRNRGYCRRRNMTGVPIPQPGQPQPLRSENSKIIAERSVEDAPETVPTQDELKAKLHANRVTPLVVTIVPENVPRLDPGPGTGAGRTLLNEHPV